MKAATSMTDDELVAAAVEASTELRKAERASAHLRREIERRDGKRGGKLARRRNRIDGR